MTKYADACAVLIHGEMKEGIKSHGLFASPHEGLAVIMEEVEEARTSLVDCESAFDGFKYGVFRDAEQETLSFAEDLYVNAKCLMIEAMQVAAMAEKYIKTFGGQNDETDSV